MAADDFDAKIVYKIVASERAFLSHVTEIRVKFKTLVHVSLTTKLNLDVAAPRFPIQILLVRGGGGRGEEGYCQQTIELLLKEIDLMFSKHLFVCRPTHFQLLEQLNFVIHVTKGNQPLPEYEITFMLFSS